MVFDYVSIQRAEVLIGKKLYGCQVIGTEYHDGECSVIVKVDGQDTTKKTTFKKLFENLEEFKEGKSVTTTRSTQLRVKCNGYGYEFNVQTMSVKYWVMGEDAPLECETELHKVMIDINGVISTTDIPSGAYPSAFELIRFKGVTKVDSEGNEKTIGGVGKLLEFNDEQNKAIDMLKSALDKCYESGLTLFYDWECGDLRTLINNKCELQDGCFDGPEINMLLPNECRHIDDIQPMYEGDVIVLQQ